MSNALSVFWNVITFKKKRERQEAFRRRANYEFLKSEISKRHYAGFNGLVVDFDQKFDVTDLGSFKPPMYRIVKNQDMKWVIFWDPKKMTEEIGSSSTVVNDGTKV